MTKFLKKSLFLLSVIILFQPNAFLFAQNLSPGDWQSAYISYLQNRGMLWDLSPLDRVYGARQIAHLLAKTADKMENDVRIQNLKQMLQILPQEPGMLSAWIQTSNVYNKDKAVSRYHGRQRASATARLRPWLEIHNSIVADNRLDEDPSYMGIRQSGYGAYTEQAYFLIERDGFQVKFGRDFIRLGAGRDATLLLSDYARPMDQLSLSYRSGHFRYSFYTASLDPTNYNLAEQPGRQYRYLSAHHLQIRPVDNLYIGITEAILYGGPEFNYDLAFVNPFIFYHGVQMNGPNGGNTFGSISLAYMPWHNYCFYGELLIDDLQIEKTGPGDLEPAEVGLVLGFNLADPIAISGADFFAEYTRITNRTYNAMQPWEKWLHRNQPIGHFAGNDFDRLQLGVSYWPKPACRFQAWFERWRRGEGRIRKTFDTPWMDIPVGESYREPFPTGVVEKSDVLHLGFHWQPRWWARAMFSASKWLIENKFHIPANEDEYWQLQFTLSIDLIYSCGFE